MSLIPANTEYLAFGIQADKDTPASSPELYIALEDCSLEPNPTKIQLAESDASAQQGNKAVVGATPGGTIRKYLRPSEDDYLIYALLGKSTDGGTTPKTHTIAIDDAAPFETPYLSVWQVWPGIGTVRYDGCRIAQATITRQPGAAAEVEYTITGLKATMGVSEPTPTFIDELPFTGAEFTATIGGSAPGTVNQATLTISRNTGRYPGDQGLTSYDVPNGLVAVGGNLEIAFENDDLWRAANTGTTGGTVLTTTLYEQSLNLSYVRGSNLKAEFDMNAIQIDNFRTALRTDGSPAVSTFDFTSKRQATIANLIEALFWNNITSIDRS